MRFVHKMSGLMLATACALLLWGCPKEEGGGAPSSGAPNGAIPNSSAGGTSANSGGTAGGTEGKELNIAVIPKGTGNAFWLGVKAGADAAASAAGNVKITWVGPEHEGDATEQVNIVQTQINNHVDGIVLAAVNSDSLATPVKTATDKGIPVVTVDSGIAPDKDTSLAYIATDNVRGGREAGEKLAELIGKKGEVALLIFKPGAASNDEREKGFKDAIAKYPDIKLVATQVGGNVTEATNNMTNILTSNKNLAGVFAASEPNGVGAISALKQSKQNGKIKLVAFDGSAIEVAGLKDGIIQALIVQDPYQMGFKGINTVLSAIKKEPIKDKKVDSGMTVVTMDNLNTPDVQKLLNPGK
ncbi:MAG TPA: ABC transporter substrate-binding protein [Chthonomonadaceae bacterium]|nr:ABC transporter substrate-binding protein [Chthonomonadaceae bacterium]